MNLVKDTSIGKYIGRTAKRFEKRPAMTYCGGVLSYAAMWDKSTRIAKGCIAAGVEHGMHVGIWANDRPNTVLCQLALLRIGAVGVMMSTSLPGPELEKRLRTTDTQYLLFDEGYKAVDFTAICAGLSYPDHDRMFCIGESQHGGFKSLEDLIEEGRRIPDATLEACEDAVSADDTDLLLFTSGSSAFPRAVQTTHYARLNTALMQAESLRASEKDRYCVAMPVFHCFSLTVNVFAALTTGACICLPENRRTGTLLELIQKEKCTVLCGVPTLFSAILARADLDGWDLSSLNTGMIGGSPYSSKLFAKICHRLNYTLLSSLGQTEATAGITASSPDDPLEVRANTVGRFWEHVEGRIVDPTTGEDVEQGGCGEICIRGYNVMLGYYKDPELTIRTFYHGEWLRTGDLARQDKNGNLHLTGRLKEMIIRGGENIAPGELEHVLSEHPAVEQVKVVGIPDPHYGEEICAVVAANGPIREEDLRGRISGCLEAFKEPRYFIFTETLPTTSGGKIDARACRERAIQEIGKRRLP